MIRSGRRFCANAVAVVFLGLLGAACVGPALAQNGEAKKALRIQEYPGSVVSLPAWAAQDAGFCAKQNLDCISTAIPSGPLGLQALATGSLEISFASTDVIMQSASRGNDVQLIVGHSPNNIYQLDVATSIPLPHRSAGYPEVMKDLVGLRSGVTARGAATEIQLRALFDGAGLSQDSATYVAVGSPGTSYPALIAKQIDMAVMFEPFHTLCRVQKTCSNPFDMAKGEGPPELAALNGGFETYAARRDFIKENPKEIAGFNQAITDVIAWMKQPDNLDKVVAIARKHMSLGDMPNADQTLAELVKSQVATYGEKIDRKSVDAFSTFLIKYKLIEKPVSSSSFVYEKAP